MNFNEREYVSAVNERVSNSNYTKTAASLALDFGKYVGYDPYALNIYRYTDFLKTEQKKGRFIKFSDAVSAAALSRGVTIKEMDGDWQMKVKESNLAILDAINLHEEAKLYVTQNEMDAFEKEIVFLIGGGFYSQVFVTEAIVYLFSWYGISRTELEKISPDEISVHEDIISMPGHQIKSKALALCLEKNKDAKIQHYGKVRKNQKEILSRGLSEEAKKVFDARLKTVYVSGILARDELPVMNNLELYIYYVRIQEMIYG